VGEIGADGRAAGAFELSDALTDSFRFALSRQIVGEIRGPEVWTMIKAMESGTGSLSTTHAANAQTCIRKLVTCAMEAGSHVTRDLATEKLSGCLNLIVQLGRRIETQPDGTQRLRRWVSEVVLVEPGEKEIGYSLGAPVRAQQQRPGASQRGSCRPAAWPWSSSASTRTCSRLRLTAGGGDHERPAAGRARRPDRRGRLGALMALRPTHPSRDPSDPPSPRARGWPPCPRAPAPRWPPRS
jgi:hypothetical protein